MLNYRASLRARRTTLAQIVGSLFVGGAALSAALPAAAANCTLTTNGDWGVAANWNCGVRPGTPNTADTATINIGGVVSVTQPEQIITLTNAGTINVDAFLLTLLGGGSTTNTGTINVGGPVTAALQVGGGHNINNTGGVINVANGSVINQFGSTITGGTINTTGTGRLTAGNSASNFLSGVTLNGTLDLASSAGIERIANGLTLNGAVNIGNNAVIATQGDQTISGTGTINFVDGLGNNRFNLEAGNLTLGSGITVRGENGFIGQQAFVGGAATLTNQGVISADVNARTITIGVNGAVINQGTMRAQNGGTLQLNASGGYDNSAGVILADVGSTVLMNGATITGGQLNTNGTGRIVANSSVNNVLNGVTLNGVLDIATAQGVARVTNGGMVLNGTINIGANSVFAPQGNQTISGNGSIVFADNNGNNRLNVEAGNLVIGSGITVRGENGNIGQQAFAGGAATLTNNGTIQADVAGGTINIGVNGTTTNNGTLAALNGGTLNLNSNIVGNVGSQILAGAGSVVNQNGVTISGIINTTGSGSFRANSSSANFFDTVTFSGTLDLASAQGVERVVNGLTLNNSTINIGANSVLAPQGNQTITGTGNIVFADANGSNRLNVEAGNLVIGSGITVRGNTGIIGQQAFVGGAATLTNNGTIQADVAGGNITIAVNGSTTNNGTLAALNGGTLNLNSNIVGNTGSQILAGAGSVVNQNGITISGDMNLTGAGSFRPSNSSANFLSGVTLSGALDMTSAGSVERITGGLTLNNATINIGANSVFAPQGNQTIGGTGTINFVDANGNNRLNVEAGNLTLGSGITVRGGNGIIGQQAFVGGAATLTNQGLISADVAGHTISMAVNGAVINQGVMRAQNGGTLLLNAGGGYDNSAGVILADVGSTVSINGATITGGQLNSNGTGRIVANASSTNFLQGVTLNGVLDMAAATGVARISNGGMVLNGTINIGANSVLAPQGNQTISGNGQIVFADANGNNRLNVEAGNLVIDSGITVRGQNGIIGQQAFVGGAASLTNNGTINADGGGTITINVNGSTTNNGTMRAQNGTLTIQDNLTGTGTLQVDATGVMNLANGGNTQGRLVMGASGSAINIGTGNLTINTDYTNSGAGTGNSFNRRAGVSGAGQIVAGGNAAQAITGANITNGNTTNATLTIGNVRVGANTFDYQVANTGSTGPTLRGAIQTNVNGANLNDARLSGTGVTPGNYNAGAPGGNSGNLAVTFNAATAGALAPLVNQSVNLRSNFENIADQKLNIVLGAGAAAYNAATGNTVTPVTIANQRVNGTNAVALNISNTAAPGAFSEDLNATFSNVTGGVTAGGSLSGRLAGTNNTGIGAINVGVATGSAGAQSGTVTINYQTAGAVNGVSNGLGTASAGSQVVSVSGNVYQAAAGQIQTPTFNFGNLQVGQQVSQNLTIRNTASGPAGFVEDLNASFGSSSNLQISGSGSMTGILAGTNSTGANGTMTVTVTGSTLGALNGNIAVNYASAGTVGGNTIAGLGTLGVGSELYGVTGTIITGNVIDTARPVINGVANPGAVSVNLGNVRIGSTANQNLNVLNQASGAPQQAALNASIASNGAPVLASGSFNGLTPGNANNASLNVGIDTSAAGVRSGSATVSLVSDITAFGNCAPNCTLNLPNQTVNVTGTVYNLANPVLNTPSVNLAARVGNASPSQVVSVTNQSADAFREGLNASISTGSTGFTASGSVTNLAAQANSGNALNVSLNTATAGTFNGSAVLTLASNGSITNNGDLALTNQNVTLSGKVYTAAQATVQNNVNFGIVHVGDVVANRGVSVQNTAPATALNDTLRAQIGGTSGAFTNNGGAAAGLTAGGAANIAALTVGLNTATAGVFNGSASVALASQNPDMADLDLGIANVTLNAQVNKFANAVFGKVGAGTLTQNGSQFILDFGTVLQGSGALSALVDVDNLVNGGPADLLDGMLNVTDGNDFTTLLSGAFQDVVADGSSGDLLSFLFNTNTLGSFQDSINLTWAGHNASGYRDQDNLYTLLVRGIVIDNNAQVPEPSSLLLMAIAIAGLGATRRKRA